MLGITLLAVPTIVYGGLTVLGIVTSGAAGLPAGLTLTPLQLTLFRAMHAHAGVLVILSLVLQILADHVALPGAWVWGARVAAPLAPVSIAAGFAGLAFAPGPRILLYTGAALVTYATVTIGIGLLRSRAGGREALDPGGRRRSAAPSRFKRAAPPVPEPGGLDVQPTLAKEGTTSCPRQRPRPPDCSASVATRTVAPRAFA